MEEAVASLPVKSSSLSSGWAAAFATAAQVQPEEIDETFLQQHTIPVDEGLSKIRTLLPPQNIKCKKAKVAEAEDDELLPLEGRIVAHPHAGRTDIMILVDTKTNIVYSAFSRTDDGDKIELGTVNPDKSISWKLDALGTFLLFVLHLVLCMYRSRHEYPIPRDISGQISC